MRNMASNNIRRIWSGSSELILHVMLVLWQVYKHYEGSCSLAVTLFSVTCHNQFSYSHSLSDIYEEIAGKHEYCFISS